MSSIEARRKSAQLRVALFVYLIRFARRIGMALTDSLDELITDGSITPQLAMKVLMQVRSKWRPEIGEFC